MTSPEQKRARQLHDRMQQERGEDGWMRLSRASVIASRRARGESDEDWEQERQRLKDRVEEIEELGFLRHDRGRTEPQALAVLSSIGEHGFSLVACSVYQDLRAG